MRLVRLPSARAEANLGVLRRDLAWSGVSRRIEACSRLEPNRGIFEVWLIVLRLIETCRRTVKRFERCRGFGLLEACRGVSR